MAVTSFKEIHHGRDGETVEGVRRYTRVFRAITSAATDGPAIIQADARCPDLGAVYPGDLTAFCRRVRCRNESFSKTVWIVTCAYSSEHEIEEDPLLDPVEIEWQTAAYREVVERGRDRTAHLNAAGDSFDPPAEADDSRWEIVITKNVSGVPSWLRTYRDAVNNAAFVVDGEEIGTGEAKVSATHLSKEQERNDQTYRVLTLTLHVRDPEFQGRPAGKEWFVCSLNQGFRQRNPLNELERIECVDDHDVRVNAPVLLDTEGRQIEDPEPGDANFIYCDYYPQKDFTVLPGCSAAEA